MRSLLIVPAHTVMAWDTLAATAADAIVLDLSMPGPVERIQASREQAAALLRASRDRPIATGDKLIFAGLNPFNSGMTHDDVAAVVSVGLTGVVLPDACGQGVERLDALLAVAEAEADLPDGSIGIIAIVGDHARNLLSMETLTGASPRLAGIGWDAKRLSTSVGAETPLQADGTLSDLCRLGHSMTLVAAAAAGVRAIDTAFVTPDNPKEEASQARRSGFSAKFGQNTAEIDAINAAFRAKGG